jgi:hypothetical protein
LDLKKRKFEPLISLIYTDKDEEGQCFGTPSGVPFSNPFTSELARDSEIRTPSSLSEWPCLGAVRQNIAVG